MPKAAMTIQELEQLLTKQKNRLKELQEKREKLTSRISKIDAELASLKGPAPAPLKEAPPVGKKQEKSLRQTIVDVLKASPQPLNAKDITGAVVKAGYKSSSKNLLTLVRLTCYKSDDIEKKGKGLFTVKKGK